MSGANHTLFKDRFSFTTLTLVIVGMFLSVSSMAQDLEYQDVSGLIYPPVEKIILPFEPASIQMTKNRKFLKIKEKKL